MNLDIQAKIQRYNLLKKDPSFAVYEFVLTEKFEKAIKEIEKKASEEMEKLRINFENKQRIHKGKDGYTPIKGMDYFTKSEIDNFIKTITYSFPKDGKTPIAGMDYPNSKQINFRIKQFISEIPESKDGKTPIKGVDYFTNKEIEEIMKKIYAELKLRIKEAQEETRGMVSAAERGYVSRIAKRTIKFEWVEPDGVCDGNNKTFTLQYAPYNPNTIMFFVNGTLQKKDDDYTIDGKIITTTIAPPTGSVKWAFFKK